MFCRRALHVSIGRAHRAALAPVRLWSSIWAHQPVVTIDGGLATEMEKKGVNIVSLSIYTRRNRHCRSFREGEARERGRDVAWGHCTPPS